MALAATFKQAPEDFRVTEVLGFEPSGVGEHLFLFIRKTNLTTERLVDDVARLLEVRSRDIGFCGLKDRQAITEQWLSIPFPIKKELPAISGQGWEVLAMKRHDRKLKRGIHKGNDFVICLKDLEGDIAGLECRLGLLAEQGFPNYFGEQRFGRDGANVAKAEALFAGKLRCKPFQRSMYYSAARSYLFNHYLSRRIESGAWDKAVPGDCFSLDGSNALFGPEPVSPDLVKRLESHDIHPAGVLAGEGDCRLQGEALGLFRRVLDDYPVLHDGLCRSGVKTAWRPLRAMPKSLNWKISGKSCEIRFSLPTGSYATALVRELVTLNEAVW